MKLLIAGSRSIQEFDLSPYIPPEVDHIICGGAEGIDALAEQYADKHRLSKTVLRPAYHLYKKAAPIRRNESMVTLADHVLIIWDGHSRGTLSTLQFAQKQNKCITLIQKSPIHAQKTHVLPVR